MKISSNYPYPVLRNDLLEDGPDINSEVRYSGNVDEDERYTYLHFEIDLRDDDILQYIKENKACYTCEVDIPKTFIRFCKNSNEPVFDIKIPRNEIAGKITVQLCVVATYNENDAANDSPTIVNYSNKHLHEDYKDETLQYYPGEIMVIAGEFDFFADIDYRKAKNFGSFMCITGNSNAKDVEYILDAQKITISVPQDMYVEYQRYLRDDKKYAAILEASLVNNALMHALYQIDEYSTKLWARSLNYLIQTNDDILSLNLDLSTDKEDIPKIAQMLLKNPYSRLFSSMGKINTLLTEED